MAWQVFRVTYELLSPLHIGYHKVGNVQRTRCYVPARNLWGAVTERLTRSGFTTGFPGEDYGEMGRWVADHLAFTYLFVLEGNKPLVPKYGDSGLNYGGLSRFDFERRYLSAYVTTALDAATTSAEVGSLHEMEYIAPRNLDRSQQPETTRLGGWAFLDEEARRHLGDETSWREWLGNLWVGGERRYGFGHLRLVGWEPSGGTGLLDGYRVDLNGDRPRVSISEGSPLLAHAPVEDLTAKGAVEPLVGRETVLSAYFGAKLIQARICWVPGSVLEDAGELEIQKRDGLWEVKNFSSSCRGNISAGE